MSEEGERLQGASEGSPLLESPNESLQSRKTEVQLYIVAVGLLFLFPFSLSQIVTYDVLFDVACGRLNLPGDVCSTNPEAAQLVANILSAQSLLNAILATATLFFISAHSDRMGRKYGLLWFMGFTTLGVAAFALIAYGVPSNTTHWRMLVPYVLIALSGTPSLLLNLSVLHITDVSIDPQLRSMCLSWFLGAAMFIQALAPGIGGAVLQNTNIKIPTYLMLCAIWMAIGTTTFGVTFHDPPRNATSLVDGDESSITAGFRRRFIQLVKVAAFSHCEHYTRRNAFIVLLNFFFYNEFSIGFLDLTMVYAKHKFGWAAARVGESLFYIFSVRTTWALVGFPLTYGFLTKIWAPKDQNVDRADIAHMSVSSILTFVGYSIISFAKTSAQYTAGLVTIANDGLSGPLWVNGLLKHVPKDQKGEFMAVVGLLSKPLGSLVPAVLMKLFQLTIDSNTVLLVVSSIALIMILSLTLLKPEY